MGRGKPKDPALFVGKAIDQLDLNIGELDKQGVFLKGFSIKAPPEGRTDWTVTIRATFDGRPVVAFTSGYTMAEALGMCINKFAAGQLKWKDDDYAK